jgi:hypothetical protein
MLEFGFVEAATPLLSQGFHPVGIAVSVFKIEGKGIHDLNFIVFKDVDSTLSAVLVGQVPFRLQDHLELQVHVEGSNISSVVSIFGVLKV